MWKTENSGITWEPLFDEAPSISIGDMAIAPTNPDIIWVGTGEANIFRASVAGTGIYKSTDAGKSWEHMGLADTHTIGRIVIHPENPDVVYVAASGHEWTYNKERGVYKTADGGKTWERISPDLSYNDPDKQGKLPFAIPYACLTSISESPLKKGLIYAGTDDGRVHVTQDQGKNWEEITDGLPYNKHVSRIVASKYDQATVYLTLNGRRDDDFNDYVYKSEDYGKTWKDISGNIPGGPVNVIREDPKKENILYVGTDLGVYVSLDGGEEWHVLPTGLPNCFVWDLKIHPRDNVLVIATNGRGMYAIDDISKIQEEN